MAWQTLEEINGSFNKLTEAVYQVLHKENFILNNSDILHIRKGRDDYEYGKAISGDVLIDIIENVRR